MLFFGFYIAQWGNNGFRMLVWVVSNGEWFKWPYEWFYLGHKWKNLLSYLSERNFWVDNPVERCGGFYAKTLFYPCLWYSLCYFFLLKFLNVPFFFFLLSLSQPWQPRHKSVFFICSDIGSFLQTLCRCLGPSPFIVFFYLQLFL